jgi:predicted alpha/beta-fold hydrolase
MLLINSDFIPSFPFGNKHFSTIYRTIFTNPKASFTRERVITDDGDFLDIDISSVNSKKVILMIHGLEGSSQSKYILATTAYFTKKNYDVIVLNLRSCSGETNNKYKSYHTGETGDLNFIIKYVINKFNYSEIDLLGFSLGGNVVLKYAGEQKENLNSKIKKVIAISPPCDLKGASEQLGKKSNVIYMKRFLKTLIEKAVIKAKLFPEENLNIEKVKEAKDFSDFDNLFTAPSFGFKDAEDYWAKASCKPFLKDIKVKSFLLIAENDPFLSTSCIPIEIAKNHFYLNVEVTKKGGHIGFIKSFKKRDRLWFEKKLFKYLNE